MNMHLRYNGKRFILPFVIFLSIFLPLRGFCLPTYGRVVDNAAILSPNEVASLETQLASYDERSSVEIILITTRDLEGLDLNEYATRLGNKLKIGKKDLDNGIVILIMPSDMPSITLPNPTAQADEEQFLSLPETLESALSHDTRDAIPSLLNGIYMQGKSLSTNFEASRRSNGFYGAGYIAPGYGIESALPDIVCRRIMMDGVRPYILAKRNYEACRMAVAMTIAELDTQYSKGNTAWARDNVQKTPPQTAQNKIKLILLAGFFFLLIVCSFTKGPVGNIARAILFAMLTSGNGSRGGRIGGGGHGSFSGGGGRFGGGGGGGAF